MHSLPHPLQFAQHLFHLMQIKLLAPELAPALSEIREYNLLLFDLALKRPLRLNGKQLLTRIAEGNCKSPILLDFRLPLRPYAVRVSPIITTESNTFVAILDSANEY